MPGTGLGPENRTVNWAELCSHFGSEIDTREVNISVKNVVREKRQGL